jgi:N-acetyl-anhydromuramyl-L-alanine amidase AmpD
MYLFDATTPRFTKPPDLAVLHWTGGIRPPQGVAQTLLARRLSVHFVVGADGEVVQFASLDRRCAHAGGVNDRSIGIEVVSPGYPGDLREREWQRSGRTIQRAAYVSEWRGQRRKVLDYTEAQTASVVELVERLCDELRIPRAVPTESDGALLQRTLTTAELAAFSGVIGHCHAHRTKRDPGSLPLERLRVRWAERHAA